MENEFLVWAENKKDAETKIEELDSWDKEENASFSASDVRIEKGKITPLPYGWEMDHLVFGSEEDLTVEQAVEMMMVEKQKDFLDKQPSLFDEVESEDGN